MLPGIWGLLTESTAAHWRGVSAYIEHFAAERQIEALEQLLYRGTTQIDACLIKVLPA
jgi:hypothetical protein